MPRLAILLALCALACSAARGSRVSEPRNSSMPAADVPAADSVPLPHAAVDLAGAWATGSAGEPAARRLVLRLQCNYTPPLWLLEQSGDTVRLWAMPASRTQGVASREPVSRVAVEGRLSGLDLTMGTAGGRYVLRYDSTSGHLRGTLNGAPFWAVRQTIVRAEGCIPPP